MPRPLLIATQLLLALLLAACTGAGPATGGQGFDADAGSDRTVAVGETVTLDGNAGPGGASYDWSMEDAPEGSSPGLSSEGRQASFNADLAGSYRLRYTVRWNGDSSSDTVTVTAVSGEPATLQPGGSAESGGLTFNAPQGALDEEVEVFAGPAPAPSEDTPLPGGYDVEGSYYRLGAGSDLTTDDKTPLTVGFPLPDDAPVDRLGLAILVPKELVLVDAPAGETIEPRDRWFVVQGVVDEEEQRLLVPFRLLANVGRTAAVVSGSRLNSPSVETLSMAAVTTGFNVRCSSEFDDSSVPESCGSSEEQDGETALEQAYNDLTGRGFKTPRLSGSAVIRDGRLTYRTHDMKLRPCSEVSALGTYTAFSNGFGTAWACLGNAGVTSRVIETIRHEYFHATQYAYQQVFDQTFAGKGEDWWLEGQATASESSIPSLARDSSRTARVVDAGLLLAEDTVTDPNDPNETIDRPLAYRSQDYWVFLLQEIGQGLEGIIPILERGPNASSTETALTSDFGTMRSLRGTYAAWARNQAIEKRRDIGGGALGNPCTFSPGRMDTSGDLYLELTYDPLAALPPSQSITLPPLTSAVVSFEFPSFADGSYRIIAEIDSSSDDLVVTFFDEADSGTTACHGTTGTLRSGHQVVDHGPGQQARHYAIISNGSASQDSSFTAGLSGQPMLTINEPSNGNYREGESISLTATATGFDDPAAVTISWEDNEGALLATSGSGETVTISRCYSGTVRATATVGSESASDLTSVDCLPKEETYFYNITQAKSGHVFEDGMVATADGPSELWVGDDKGNFGIRTFVHFPLTLPDDLAQITSATLTINLVAVEGSPYTDLGELKAYHTDYGDNLDAGDYLSPGLPGLATFPFNGSTTNGRIEVDMLEAVQDAFDNRATRGDKVQFGIYFPANSDDDGSGDYVRIYAQDRPATYLLPALEVRFENF